MRMAREPLNDNDCDVSADGLWLTDISQTVKQESRGRDLGPTVGLAHSLAPNYFLLYSKSKN